MTLLALSLAGGLGAVLRFTLDRAVMSHHRPHFALGTFVVNMLGATVLGIVLGLAATAQLTTASVDIVGTGLLGGFTTFSTLTYESFFLLTSKDRWPIGLLNYLGSLSGGLILYFLAFEITRRLN
jgi:CrcB protein